MKLTILLSLLPILAYAAPTEPQVAQIGPALTSPYLPSPGDSSLEYSHSKVHSYGKRQYKETYYVDLFNKSYMWVMIEDDKNGTMAKTTRWEHRAMLTSGGPSISSAAPTSSIAAIKSTSSSVSVTKAVSSSASKAASSSTAPKPASSSSALKPASSSAAVSRAASSSVAAPRPSSVSSKPPTSSSSPVSVSVSVSKAAVSSSVVSKVASASASASVSKAIVISSASKAAVSSSVSKAAAVSSSAPKSSATSSSVSKAPVVSSTSKAAALSTTSSSIVPVPSASTAAGVSAADQAQFLSLHNQFRARYSAGAVVWDNTLASFALKTAQTCKYGHTGGPYGENIAAGVGGGYNIDKAFSSWANEDALYDFNKPGYSSATGHFTQIVWKGTGKIGCASASCADGTIFTGYRANSTYVVCEYQAPGNVVSSDPARTAQIFTANVGPKVA